MKKHEVQENNNEAELNEEYKITFSSNELALYFMEMNNKYDLILIDNRIIVNEDCEIFTILNENAFWLENGVSYSL